MKLKFRQLALVFITILLTMSLVGCGSKPDKTVKGFFDSIKKSDFNSMATYVKNDGNKDSFKFKDKEQEKLVKAILPKVSHKIVSSKVDGNNATVKAQITSLDLPRIYSSVLKEMMPVLVGDALSNKTDDAESKLMQTFINAMNDPNAPKTTTDVDIKLVKGEKGWLIEPTDDFLDALTGNMNKAFANNN